MDSRVTWPAKCTLTKIKTFEIQFRAFAVDIKKFLIACRSFHADLSSFGRNFFYGNWTCDCRLRAVLEHELCFVDKSAEYQNISYRKNLTYTFTRLSTGFSFAHARSLSAPVQMGRL